MPRPIARLVFAAFAAVFLAVPLASCVAADAPTPDSTKVSATTAPPGEALAAQALEGSPRHHEWVDISLGEEKPKLRTFVAYPERKDKAPVVVVIQEIFGLTPWVRSVADRLAADGFIAIAPDYLSGLGPGGGGSDSVKSRDETVKLTRGLTPEEVMKRTHAAVNYGERLPASNGRAGTMGFCWGGSMSFLYAAEDDEPDAAVVFYGSAPDTATLRKVDAPVLGLYGEDDARVNETIPAAKAAMAANQEFFEANLYPGAGHGFLRAQGEREGANARAAGQAWPRAIAFLREHLETPKAGSSGTSGK
jgi:carboxymethylenebutenolidase